MVNTGTLGAYVDDFSITAPSHLTDNNNELSIGVMRMVINLKRITKANLSGQQMPLKTKRGQWYFC